MLSLLKIISAKDLAARPFRVATFVVAIALGVALVVAMTLATDSVVRHFNEQLDKVAGAADLQITFGTGEAGFPEEVVETVKKQPSVNRAVALVRGVLTFAEGTPDELELFGVDVLDADVEATYRVRMLMRTADDFTIINDPHGVFLSDSVAAARHLALGDRVKLASTTGVDEYTVHGIFAGTGLAEAYDGQVAVMYLPAAQGVLGLWGKEAVSNIHQIDVVLDGTASPSAAADELRKVLPRGLAVSEPEQRKIANARLVGGLRATLIGISVFALVAAMFIVYSTTAALVAQRTPVLGTFIVAGASPLQVSRLVLVEAAVLGLLGGFIGTGLGMVMASFAVADAAVGLSLNYSIDFAPIGSVFALRPELLLFPLLGSIAAVLSAVFPAWRIRRLDPLALQRVGIVDEGTNASSLSIVTAGGCVLALVGTYSLKTGTTHGSPLLCAAGTTMLVLSAILLTLPVVRAVWSALRSPVQRVLRTAGWVSIEQLNRNVERSLLTVAAIALCIGVVLAASTLPRSFRVSVAHWYAFYGDAVVTSRIHQGGWLSAAASDSFEKLIAETAGVDHVETLRVLQGQEYHGDRIAVAALSDGYIERALQNASAIAANDKAAAVAAVERGTGAAISENMAVHYSLSTGDTLELETPTSHLSLPVVAVVPDFVSDRGSVLLERGLVGRHWRDKLVNYFAVFLAPGTDVEAFRRAFGEAGGERARSLAVLSMSSLLSQIDTAIAAAFADIAALQLLVIVITIAGIVDLVVSNVLDRRRLHAILRVAGTTDGGIVRLITCEGGMIGVSAGVLGVALGMLASWIWIRFTYPVLVGYVLRLDFAWTNAVLCVSFAIATAILAGGVTGYARLRESPIAAVRAE